MHSLSAHDDQALGLSETEDESRLESLADEVLAEAIARSTGSRLPVATYRLQLCAEFTLAAATKMVGYLAALGVSDVYASPVLQAMPGSPHGYDVVDHQALNAEIGTVDDLRALAQALQARGMGLVMDVVPNHMSAAPEQNAWWRDVLENGPSSRFANFFDIDWMPLKPDLAHKVLLPVLEDQFGKVLEEGLLRVAYQEGSFWLTYHDHRYPLTPQSWPLILDWNLESLGPALGSDDPQMLEFLSILTAIRNLPPLTETDPVRREERQREQETSKRRLAALAEHCTAVADLIAGNVQAINGTAGEPRTFDRLEQLIDQQAYRLAHWRTATDEINYRRFFDINQLAAISMERPEVFAATHARVFEWIDQGIVAGLRIDHPDGLLDPPEYLRQLQERRFRQICQRVAAEQLGNDGDRPDVPQPAEDAGHGSTRSERAAARAVELWRASARLPGAPLGRPLYVVVEKILGHGEQLPEDWPVHGTVGYEFLNALGGLFVEPAGEKPLSALFTRFTGETLDFREVEYACKRLIAGMSMSSELHVLGYQLDRMSERNRRTRDFTLASLIEAVQEVISCFRVYRTYVYDEAISEHDRQYIEAAIARARRRNPAMDASVFDFLRDVLLLRHAAQADVDEQAMQRSFVGKFQQLTGPIMAKSVEDTAFYRFNRLVSLNEVGGEPARFGADPAAFHRLNAQRLPRLARGLSATTTHDTKRSEDVRARISVLSEIAGEWRAHVMRWSRWHRRLKTNVEGVDAPSRNDEYLLYQTLVGVWPGSFPTAAAQEEFAERIQQYALKVAREAKVHTSWINQHQGYEQALLRFVQSVLTPGPRRPFLADLDAFAQRVAEHGRWNSLAQTLLKIASPGVPDFFQGTESWTLTLVDPDNRRPVDFAARARALDELDQQLSRCLDAPGADSVAAWLERGRTSAAAASLAARVRPLVAELLHARGDGRLKLYCTQLALRARRALPALFTEGSYEPLAAEGSQAQSVVAFARQHGDDMLLAIAPRATVRVTGFGGPVPCGDLWSDTHLVLPEPFAGRSWWDVLGGRVHPPNSAQPQLALRDLLGDLPVALLLAQSR
ncbi:MAG: malto-oligosyltrehalose synthase [Planctomycetaceae bacterium]|nr:malto-oligosyltrehalose synthase [Planctomycetaceae bacterium]